ncbi:Glu/Leu/Phe/Val dehydrogenase dimerization domain-containing protein [Sphingomonas sp. 4RDLI-65]|uniref:Glu/Leu/Phe/Val family dehydrogenase n=1 Tax=Sphingomonas sp. 4RDLI-65 TaxID=3111641 RepID=UPI003C21688E
MNFAGELMALPEEVVPLNDPESGLTGIIVLHSTRLGPAAGGCRLWNYSSATKAAEDAMRLARGMTFKNALAGLPLGGGKAVIRQPDRPFDRDALFRAFGRAIETLDGRYLTAEDVGTTVGDMEIIAHQTRHVAGRKPKPGLPGGDPSPWTARGVFEAMQVAVELHLGASLAGLTVGVQGLGNVGFALCELLHEAGAKLMVAELNSAVAARAAVRFGAHVLTSEALIDARIDVLAPCALGGTIDFVAVGRLRARVICGAANNQLFHDDIGRVLADRGILYAPDYLVNAGGIINVAGEHFGWAQTTVSDGVAAIGPRLREVLGRANDSGLLPLQAAEAVALSRIEAVRGRHVLAA